MKRFDATLLIILFLIAFSLRFYDLPYPSFKWMDEVCHVPAATNYLSNGQFEPDSWEQPPLRHITLYGFLQVFGDNPYGWRMRNVLFGVATALLTYLFAREVSGRRRTAFMAGLILATDPLHVVLSRFSYEEIYGGTFCLASIVLYQMHKQRSLLLIMSALFMGCALATKWYYVPCLLLLYMLALHNHNNYRSVKSVFFITCTYLFVPLTAYIFFYFPWFGRGYTITEFIEFVGNAYRSLQLLQLEQFDSGLFFLKHSQVSEWFTRPVIVGQGTYLGADHGEFTLYGNNLPVWILTIPALIGMTISAILNKNLKMALPALFFCASFMLFLFVKRPIFIYSAAPVLPFAFTLIAQGICLLTDKFSPRLSLAVIAVIFMWNMYLYPLVTAKKVPLTPYRYILNNAYVEII